MRSIADVDHGRDNNFNLLRMIAASAVMVSHAWPMTLTRAASEPLVEVTDYSLGVLCVVVFFAISGYFITKSFDRRTLLADFVVARVCRIFPALIVALLLSAFVLGPMFTVLSSAEYFRSASTWIYAPQNALLIHQRFQLPGVFNANPFPGVVNGSLWTLKYEVGCYAGVVVAGLAGLLRPRFMPVILLAALAAAVMIPAGHIALSSRLAVLCGAFAIGAGVYVYRAHVPASLVLVAVLAVIAVVTRSTPVYRRSLPPRSAMARSCSGSLMRPCCAGTIASAIIPMEPTSMPFRSGRAWLPCGLASVRGD